MHLQLLRVCIACDMYYLGYTQTTRANHLLPCRPHTALVSPTYATPHLLLRSALPTSVSPTQRRFVQAALPEIKMLNQVCPRVCVCVYVIVWSVTASY